MKIYRVSHEAEIIPGTGLAAIDAEYFLTEDNAMARGRRLALVYEAAHDVTLELNTLRKYGILAVWTDRWPKPTVRIKLEEGTVEDAEEPDQEAETEHAGAATADGGQREGGLLERQARGQRRPRRAEAAAVQTPEAGDEEMTPHPFKPLNWARSIWCVDCEYHRDHQVHR